MSRRLERTPELPPRPFLYTLDQIAALVSVEEERIRKEYCYFEGRSTGRKYPDLMSCRNVAPALIRWPDWRVSELELKRWFKYMGFRFHERGWVS